MVVEPDQASTLRNQEMLTRLGVEDGLAHLCDQLPREVRADPRQEHRWNDGSGLHLVRTRGFAESRGENVRALCLRRGWTCGRRQARGGRPGCLERRGPDY